MNPPSINIIIRDFQENYPDVGNELIESRIRWLLTKDGIDNISSWDTYYEYHRKLTDSIQRMIKTHFGRTNKLK